MLDHCDCCGDLFPIDKLELSGNQLLCEKCRRNFAVCIQN